MVFLSRMNCTMGKCHSCSIIPSLFTWRIIQFCVIRIGPWDRIILISSVHKLMMDMWRRMECRHLSTHPWRMKTSTTSLLRIIRGMMLGSRASVMIMTRKLPRQGRGEHHPRRILSNPANRLVYSSWLRLRELHLTCPTLNRSSVIFLRMRG